MSLNAEQLEKMKSTDGFIAALDQSGGSTPKALLQYGVQESEYDGDEAMFQKVHDMRTRIITCPKFGGDRVLAAILFENTMDREINGKESATYLWEDKKIVPLIKVDKGLAAEENGVQVMKPNPGLDDLCKRAKAKGIFGTKMRSNILLANKEGIQAVVDQQFEVAKQICAHGLCPIIEPEVNINSTEKAEAEVLLKEALLKGLDALGPDQLVMLKLTLPEKENFYKECIDHKMCVRVVALSGGYSRDVANERLSKQNGMIASFSRGLSQGLSQQQTEEEFNTMIDESVQSIFDASRT